MIHKYCGRTHAKLDGFELKVGANAIIVTLIIFII